MALNRRVTKKFCFVTKVLPVFQFLFTGCILDELVDGQLVTLLVAIKMFHRKDDSYSSLAASKMAAEHIKLWEKTLSLRISLQKAVDFGNQLPVEEEETSNAKPSEMVDLLTSCQSLVDSLTTMLEDQAVAPGAKKRKRGAIGECSWDRVFEAQQQLRPHWEEVVNKWHSRLQFGSNEAASKMKTFKQTLWEQV